MAAKELAASACVFLAAAEAADGRLPPAAWALALAAPVETARGQALLLLLLVIEPPKLLNERAATLGTA